MGQPLGKRGEGHTIPVEFDVKIDRHGLSTLQDKKPPVVPAAALMATNKQMPSCLAGVCMRVFTPPTTIIPSTGKHPVSALQELCTKKHWPTPVYELVNESGPGHMKTFLYRVSANQLISYGILLPHALVSFFRSLYLQGCSSQHVAVEIKRWLKLRQPLHA